MAVASPRLNHRQEAKPILSNKAMKVLLGPMSLLLCMYFHSQLLRLQGVSSYFSRRPSTTEY